MRNFISSSVCVRARERYRGLWERRVEKRDQSTPRRLPVHFRSTVHNGLSALALFSRNLVRTTGNALVRKMTGRKKEKEKSESQETDMAIDREKVARQVSEGEIQ